ncbi:FKBP-type peptidyl-prolyl cis-trans isomerase FkpA [Shewanella violacea DSS12]|uniref:Peptidyl-prolyl cis-trans isomerase n=1 Tax=Shewanella violacea (strain JCM 10179 / CIP 106290 / LMG 19151 / DSS12) TaxID=637905 RepID=D4ZMB2_SHEVD|nr:FKBP-type peptidyl-prolyl cis-trans isomerase FkpA [Shewanella violacea DSS12]
MTQSSKLTDVEIQALLADYDKAVQWLSSTATASAKHSLTAQEELHLKDVGYAIGVSKGAFLQLQLVSYRQLGFEFDASELIAGFKDGLNHDLALSQTEVTDLLVEFDVWVKSREQERAAVTARQRTAAGEIFIDQFSHKVGVVTTPDGVSYQVLSPVADTGGKPTMGDTVIVDYHGRLIDGNEFVSGAKTQLKLAEVIPGLADGLQQMNIGSTVRVVIPAALGFGDVSTELVPSHSVLIFDVTLLSIVPDNNKGCNSSTCLGD